MPYGKDGEFELDPPLDYRAEEKRAHLNDLAGKVSAHLEAGRLTTSEQVERERMKAMAKDDKYAAACDELKKQLTAMAIGVDEFQRRVMDLPVARPPAPLPDDRSDFRVRFMREEIDEYNEARDEGRFAEQIDALVDLVYIAIGALLEMGIHPLQAFDPVQYANMQKLRGVTKRGHHYDAVKPDGWQPPDHEAVILQMKVLAAVSPVFLEATAIVLQRGADYNHGEEVRREDHFPFGAISIFQMMWVKIKRLESDLRAGRPPKRDHLIDLINYARFMVDHCDGRAM